jgi:hypothetical protein
VIGTALLLAQAAISSPASITWDNITLGAPASSIRALFGDPLRVVLFDNPPERIARYSFPGSDSTYVLVMEERGYVKGVEIFTDAATGSLKASRPIRSAYDSAKP